MTIAAAAQKRYAEKGPTGFLKPVRQYVVIDSVNRRYVGTNRRDALRSLKTWKRIAPDRPITVFCDGKEIESYKPKTP